jgi:hypothetical protein
MAGAAFRKALVLAAVAGAAVLLPPVAGAEQPTQWFASFERVSVPAPSIEVDTTDGYTPGLAEIVDFVNQR